LLEARDGMNLSEAPLFGKKNGTGLKVEGSEFKV